MTTTNQPDDLRDYLSEAEALVTEWYTRDGIEPSHDKNLDYLATLTCLHAVMGDAPTFDDMKRTAIVYLIAAFQMGRKAY